MRCYRSTIHYILGDTALFLNATLLGILVGAGIWRFRTYDQGLMLRRWVLLNMISNQLTKPWQYGAVMLEIGIASSLRENPQSLLDNTTNNFFRVAR